jgi:hypothetical protein
MVGDFNFKSKYPNGCECCKNIENYYFYTGDCNTSTISTHKWTEEEIEEEIINLSLSLQEVGIFSRPVIRRQLKHWAGKLKKLREAKEEFKLTP